ncbi:protein SERAC1 [Arctopsyche grandis]|uniref:protein SERAC1 n=1 Tax=Arctopsyche grandis TaxID=121162 RepID=UPI00406D83A6
MAAGVRQLVWAWRLRGWKAVAQHAPAAAAITAITCVCSYGIIRTKRNLNRIIANNALETERSGRPEYLYVRDPAYEERIRQHLQDEDAWSFGPSVGRWISRFRRTLWRRLLHISRNGDPSDRKKALHHLSSLKHLKEWDWVWLSQRLDAHAVVWLARHGGRCAKRLAGGTPPLPQFTQSISLISTLANLSSSFAQPCSCLKNFLQEQIDNHQDVQRLMEQETSGGNKEHDENVELLNCLEVLLHHLNMSSRSKNKLSESAEEIFAKSGGLTFIQKAATSTERPLRLCAARLMLRLSHYPDLLPLIHRSGLISTLASWIDETEHNDSEISCMAAGILAGLENGTVEETATKEIYDPSVYLLHPTYRPKLPPKIDVVFIHGLLGEPFVTWRQRDQIDGDVNNSEQNTNETNFNFNEDDNFEIVWRDIPESAVRNPNHALLVQNSDKVNISQEEKKNIGTKTKCWPRDWLPSDCPNIRVLGVSYETMMMEWSSGCGDVSSSEDRALLLGKALQKAGVGTRPIVWVAHSMGGVLVKHILVHSLESKDEENKKIANNTKGIIFFSTPHHGSRAAQALIWPSKEVQELRKDSRMLSGLHSRWLKGKWPSICVGESRSTQLLAYPSLSLHLVPPESADDNVGPLYTLPLDHLDICKPATKYSFIYRIVVEMIQHSKEEKCGMDKCSECLQNVKNTEEHFIDFVTLWSKTSSELEALYEKLKRIFDSIRETNTNSNSIFKTIHSESDK